MTDTQVPDAVREAISELYNAATMDAAGPGMRHKAIAAVATVLRERDEEIARLKADIIGVFNSNDRIAKLLDHERKQVKRLNAELTAMYNEHHRSQELDETRIGQLQAMERDIVRLSAERHKRPTLQQVLDALANATWYHKESYDTAVSAVREAYVERERDV